LFVRSNKTLALPFVDICQHGFEGTGVWPQYFLFVDHLMDRSLGYANCALQKLNSAPIAKGHLAHYQSKIAILMGQREY
jgi:hypothetical protein